MVPDYETIPTVAAVVSIRFKVRDGFRLGNISLASSLICGFQSALRFAVVSDQRMMLLLSIPILFQSALRFAVVSDGVRNCTRNDGCFGFNPL